MFSIPLLITEGKRPHFSENDIKLTKQKFIPHIQR